MFKCEFKLDLQYLMVHFNRMIFFFNYVDNTQQAHTIQVTSLTFLSKAIGKYIFTFTWQILYFTLIIKHRITMTEENTSCLLQENESD